MVQFLAGVTPRMNEVPALLAQSPTAEQEEGAALWKAAYLVRAAVHLVGVHRLRECLPYLRQWETVSTPGYTTSSGVMPAPWCLEGQLYRPVVHHVLKLLGERPRGFSTYGFVVDDDSDTPERFPMPECLSDRCERAARVRPEMSAEEVLRLLGSPDRIRSPLWEYDLWDGTSWTTLRLAWQSGPLLARLAVIEYVAPYWLEPDDCAVEVLRD